MISNRSAGLLSGLIYPIQFERDPLDGVARVVKLVVARSAMGGTPQEFLAAIVDGLQSEDALADQIPQPHDEVAIRRFLSATAAAIRARWPT